MRKYAHYIFVLCLAASVSACGGGGSSAPTTVYDHPASTVTPPDAHRGGAVQGTPLVLGTIKVTTLAGTAGTAGFANYSSTTVGAAIFNHPTGITTDGTNYYVADYNNNMIRKINQNGTVTLVAGSGFAGFSDGVGAAARFNHPSDITTDGINLYVADTGNNNVRIIELANNNVTTIGSTSSLAGSIDSATDKALVRFNLPTGITTDGVNLFVTDSGNHTVRRILIADRNAVATSAVAVSTLAGGPGSIGTTDDPDGKNARFNLPARITTDGTNLYLTDFNNRTIRKIGITSGSVTTIAGITGPLGTDNGTLDAAIGTAARFNQPNGITTDGSYLYVTDSFQNSIRRIDISTIGATNAVTTIPVPDGKLHTPIGITTDGVSLLVANTSILNLDNSFTQSNSIIRISGE